MSDERTSGAMTGNETKTLTEMLADYALSERSLTARDVRMLRLIFMDWIAAAQTGVTESSARILMEAGEAEGIRGTCTVIGQNRKSSMAQAALINGTESHAIDFDDIHDYLSLHLCSPVCPAALAAAEETGADGLALMTATVNGMQVMTALSAGIMPEHYNKARWHATGTLGIFGAAAAAGYLLELTAAQMNSAFGICAGLMSGIQLNFGSMAKPMAAGMAAKNGVLAAQLAARGFTGRKDIFDTDFLGNIALKEVNPSVIAERLAGPLGIHELRFKRYPCGAPTHSGIINCRKILEEHPHSVEEIERIVFHPYPRAVRLVGNMDPKTGLEGKFSIAFTAAAQIVFGQVTIETFTDEHVQDPRVQYLLSRMELEPDDEFTYSRGGRAEMFFTDGTCGAHTTYLLGHEIDLDETEPEVRAKFREIMEPRVGQERAEEICACLDELERLESAEQLCRIL